MIQFVVASFLTTNLGASKTYVFSLLGHTGVLVRFVLLFLVILSIVCWAVIFGKLWRFRKVKKETISFLSRFHQQKNLSFFYKDSRSFSETPLVYVFRAGYGELLRLYKTIDAATDKVILTESVMELIHDSVYRSMVSVMMAEKARLERWLSVLASTGSSAPFIGLFGTVWGIMNSFRSIGLKGAANLAVVAPGIAEALIATAVGLAAAIPAVIAYNFFMQKLRVLDIETRHFISDFMRLVERDIIKKMGTRGSEESASVSVGNVRDISL